MRTIEFDDVFDDAVRASGLPSGTTITATQAERIARYVQHRLRRIWTWQFWGFLLKDGERDTVERSDGAVYVPLEVDFEEPLGDLYENGIMTGVSRRNPRTSSVCDWLNVARGSEGVYLPAGYTDAAVFVMWRRPPPRFTRAAWAGGTAYGAGDLVYHGGECWEAVIASTGQTPSTASDYWRLQEIPAEFESYVRKGVTADVLREMGNLQQFGIAENLADSDLRDIAWRHQEPMQLRVNVAAAGVAVLGAAASASGGAVKDLNAATTVDWTVEESTLVYEVPPGFDLAILGWLLTTDSISGSGAAPEIELGTTGASDSYWSGTLQAMEAGGVHVVQRPQNLIGAGAKIFATVATASGATSHSGKVVIRGHLIAT